MRICTKCGENKAESEYKKVGKGLSKVCSACLGEEVKVAEVKEEVEDVKNDALTEEEAMSIIIDANQTAHLPEEYTPEDVIALAKKIPQEKMYRIILVKKEDDEADMAFVQVNGDLPTWIKRGEEVVVRARIVEALRNAVTFSHVVDDDKNIIRAIPRHTEQFQVLGEVE